MKTVLITGGSSYLGRGIITKLLNDSYRVISLYHSKKNTDIKNFNFLEFYYDFEEELSIPRFDFNIDFICHLAAYIPNNMSDSNLAEKCLIVNSLGTLKLLKFAKEFNIPRFIYASGNLYDSKYETVSEETPLYPSKRATYYLTSKLVGEIYVKHFEEQGNIQSTILRFSSLYGNLLKQDFITRTIFKLLNSEKINVFNPNYKIDLTYIQDAIDVTVKCIKDDIIGSFNISSNELISISQIVDLILDKLHSKRPLVEFSESNNTDKGFPKINNELATKRIGYTPTRVIDGINKIINNLEDSVKPL
jgi:UDP-glucose 4-epimerase